MPVARSENSISIVLMDVVFLPKEGANWSRAKCYNIDKGEIFYHSFPDNKQAKRLQDKYGERLNNGERVEILYNLRYGRFYEPADLARPGTSTSKARKVA